MKKAINAFAYVSVPPVRVPDGARAAADDNCKYDAGLPGANGSDVQLPGEGSPPVAIGSLITNAQSVVVVGVTDVVAHAELLDPTFVDATSKYGQYVLGAT